ncbi:class I SAM-dependent methyltransferase [Maliponia aquimaris]|uniref:Glycine/sarcosine/dimethylglycine N-methyltransferase n=1 Tax=Maliponia aquimaris TaxID=1673631 RepID=A0A238KRE7_9RHOB|nr:class I SAM-dependent methyltransferase [Maliponia aquimaris]SMX45181.1 Glycine/sarcosine/dimethylglycine N-methyltransferase [Maliponia aquimaris]
MSTAVQEHYGSADIVARILSAIPWAPETGNPLTPDMLYRFDQLHGRELHATRDHAARLSPKPGAHVLDIGSGIGGPARYLAATCGCRVMGIDLTLAFVDTARDLTALCGLGAMVDFVQGDAAHLPMADAGFDHALCFYVGMNLPDSSAVLAECLRVLKPGGRLVWTEVTTGTGAPHYPLPWARTAEASFLDSHAVLLDRFARAGFDVVDAVDETQAHLDLARQLGASGQVPDPAQTQCNAVVLGADFMERRANYTRSLSEGRIASTCIEARKPL